MAIQMTREEYRQKYGQEAFSGAMNAVADTPAPPAGQTGVKGFATGVGKSALGLVQGAGELGRGIQRGISEGIGAVTGAKDFGLGGESVFDKGTEKSKQLTALTTPNTTSESIGKFAGDVAQFAIPGGAATKMAKTGGTLTKMAAAGGSDALVQSVQQGGIDRNSVDTAILGALFPAFGKATALTKVNIGPKAGAKIINSLIKPMSKQFSYGKNPGRAVAESGIKASSLEELTAGIGKARQDNGVLLSTLAKQVPQNVRINASPALASFDEAMRKAVASNDQALLNRLTEAKTALTQIMGTQDGKILPTGTRILDNLTYEQGVDLKRVIGDITKWTGQKTEDETVNGALTRAYGALKGQLDSATRNVDPKLADKLKKANERYADLTAAQIASRNREAIAQRANLVSLPDITTGASAGIIGSIATGGAVTPAILIGLGATGIKKALSTPAAKTRIASWLAAAPPEEIKSMWKQAPWLRSALQASLFAEETDDGGPNSTDDDGS